VTHDEFAALESHILHPQAQRLHEAHAGAIEQPGHQPHRAAELRQQRPHLPWREHHRQAARVADERQRYALALHQPATVPPAFNGFRAWNWIVLFLMVAAYGYPIAQFFINPPPEAVVHRVD